MTDPRLTVLRNEVSEDFAAELLAMLDAVDPLRVRDDTTPEPAGKLPPELKVQFECGCSGCDNAAEQTEFSPYMDDFCHECTMRRCDVVGHGPVGDVTTPKPEQP